MNPHDIETVKYVGDATSVAAAVTTWFWAFMPHLVLVLAVIWWVIRIYETKTITGWAERFALWRKRHDG